MKAFSVGLLGERRAELYLRLHGLRILKRRYRVRHGEIDLIAREGDATVFVEVKARPRGEAGEGLRAVDARKRQRLRYAAQWYLSQHPAKTVRFDVVEITKAGIRHIKNAF